MWFVRRFFYGLLFLLYYVRELVLSNLQVAWEVVTPRHHQRPGIVRFPTRARTDLEITLLANAISFTPGTLTLEVAEDRDALFVHVLHSDGPEATRDKLRRLEERLLAVFRS